MNTAAGIAFVTVMLGGMGGLTALVYRDRRRTQPAGPEPEPEPEPVYIDQVVGIRFRGGDIYQETVAVLGDPTHIDTDPPACPNWPA